MVCSSLDLFGQWFVLLYTLKNGKNRMRCGFCLGRKTGFLIVELKLASLSYFSEEIFRTLFDLHLGHIRSLTSCLGSTGILYSCPQCKHFKNMSNIFTPLVHSHYYSIWVSLLSVVLRDFSALNIFRVVSISLILIFWRMSSRSRISEQTWGPQRHLSIPVATVPV